MIWSCLSTQKPKVGVWQGPNEINDESKLPYFLYLKKKIFLLQCSNDCRTTQFIRTWKNFVWNRVKAQPILRSNSCRASTLSASFSFGLPKLYMAALTSFSVIDENRARHTTWKAAKICLYFCLTTLSDRKKLDTYIIQVYWTPHRFLHGINNFETDIFAFFIAIEP